MGRIGRRIGDRYRLVEKLGTGGMSVVWRGHDEILGRAVAVKVLSPQLAGDAVFRDRLRQEALAAARLCHPHITGIFDFGESPLSGQVTVPYVVMELNDGESIAARLGRRGALAWREAVTMAAEVASALATAHSHGVVHRDVTPANVMLTSAGAKVVDFGISALIGQRDAAPDGSLLGTPAYLAPERLSGDAVTPATDVYALGLLLYRTLTARFPWPAGNTNEALRAHLYADPEPLPSLPGMPTGVADLCLSCLAKSPTDRPTAFDVANRLAAVVGLQPIVPRPAAQPAPDNRPTAALARTDLIRDLPAKPILARRAHAKPVHAKPGLDKPGLVQPGLAELSPAQSGHAESGLAEPGLAEPGLAEPGLVEPGLAQPGSCPADRGDAVPPRRIPVDSARPGRRDLAVTRPTRLAAIRTHLVVPHPVPARAVRLRAGLKIGKALHLGGAKPLGGGLFLGGRLAHDLLSGRHRIQAAAITVTLLAVVGLSWTSSREPADVGPPQAAGAGAGPPRVVRHTATCKVRYRVDRDTGSDFEARLTLINTGGHTMTGWRLAFAYPGTQRLADPGGGVAQHGRRVVLRARADLDPGKSATVALRGAYRGSNPLPLIFKLGGRACLAEVLGATTIEQVDGEKAGYPKA